MIYRGHEIMKSSKKYCEYRFSISISIKLVEMNWFIKMYDLWKKKKKKQWNSCSLWIIKIFYEILESISLKNEILDIVHRVSNCRIKHNLKLTNGVPSELRIARESENEKSQKYGEHTLIDPSHKTKWNNQ